MSPTSPTRHTFSHAFVLGQRVTTLGPVTETRHRIHVAVARPDGQLLASAGDPHTTSPARSCLKPFQAQALLRSGAWSRFELGSRELALACASHEAATLHTELVARWLERLSLPPTALQCGAHPPGDKDALTALQRAGASPTPLHNNCSGKHAAMLSAALALNADPRHYLHARHPVQRLIREALADHLPPSSDSPRAELPWGVDGCSAPTPALSMHALATLFARLLAATAPTRTPAPVDDPDLAATARAMMEHPELVGGQGVIDTRLMRSVPDLVAKRGADGVYALAVLHPIHGPLGAALKVEDGSDLARGPAVLTVLDQLVPLTPPTRVALADLIRPDRKNHRGLIVGHLLAEVPLTWR